MFVGRPVLIAVVACGFVAGGCVSPPEIKAASTKQVELTKELPGTVSDAGQALHAYLDHLDDLSFQTARLKLAADLVAVLGSPPARTHDEVMDRAGMLDYALQSLSDLAGYQAAKDQAVATLPGGPTTKAVAGEAPATTAVRELGKRFDTRINQIKGDPVGKAKFTAVPEAMADQAKAKWVAAVAAVERDHQVIVYDEAELARELAFLSRQAAVMASAAQTIDEWVQTDVTVTADQADALRTNLTAAADAIGARGGRSAALKPMATDAAGGNP